MVMVLFTNAWLSLGINDAISPPLPLEMKAQIRGNDRFIAQLDFDVIRHSEYARDNRK